MSYRPLPSDSTESLQAGMPPMRADLGDDTLYPCRGNDSRRRIPAPEQLVFPFQLRRGDVVLDDGARLEVVGPPASMSSGKTARVMVRRDGDTSAHPAVWQAWRKLRVIRPSAA